MELSFGEIARMMETAPPSQPNLRATGYSIDSRTIQPGELFFAVQGQRLDGHDFVPAALAAGAAGAVVISSRREDFPAGSQAKLLGVQNPLEALQRLAAAVRRRWGGPLVAVTGSAGKTITKQMIASLLGTRFRVLANEGNLNNHFGLPLSLLRLQPETEVGVFEMGMSGPGEIRLLAGLAAPDVGVVTNVSAVHLEFFSDVEAIARAKFELLESLGSHAWAVLNAEDPRVCSFGERFSGRVLYFGFSGPAHFQAQDLARNGSGGFRFTVPAKPFQAVPPGLSWKSNVSAGKGKVPASGAIAGATGKESSGESFHLPLLGRHNVLNLLAALAACYCFGLPPGSLREAVRSLRPAPMRGEMIRLANGAMVVNDCYNSNPEALDAMLASVASLDAKRRFAVLGEMRELGPSSETLHYRCGQRLGELSFDGLFTVGDGARPFADGARAAGVRSEALAHFASAEEAAQGLQDRWREGDVVLLKASRTVHLERVWEVWQRNPLPQR
ncbi:MAG: UDP-N-acetylmuramoyl-tripeptide--D-alanyl-D-alanine ligase [Acidobacteria bacterium]|nr:UDP-N-acetylmuramoyl-tripeptide--D-alanyl-D-alanine ligase [Acidobacteriota bacterium]